MKVHFVIEHEKRGRYMEHRVSAQTGKQAPRFTYHREPKKFDTRQEAQDMIAAKGLKRCVVREITPKGESSC